MPFRLTLLVTTALLAPATLAAQTPLAPPRAPLQAQLDEDDETIVVTGQKPRGSVVGDIPPENVLGTRDIRATGATTIAELISAVASQTGSARGRGEGRPILLLNGQRISGFRELRDLPPEAIERMEILPEEVALKYGYSADQRVINIVLRRRFNSTGGEIGATLATEGGYSAGRLDATKLRIADGARTSLNLRLDGNSPLYESERDIAFDPAAGRDPRDFRTLSSAGRSARLTGTFNRTLGQDIGATLTGEVGRSRSVGRFGETLFDPGNPLTRDTTSTNAGLGAALNLQRGKWRYSSTANAQLDHVEGEADRSLLAAPGDDRNRSTRSSLAIDATANGPLFALPAGDATATLKVGLSRLDIDSRAVRRGITSAADLGRTIAEESINLDLPLAKRSSAIGRLGLNFNAGLSTLSDFDTLTSVGGGFNWAPVARASLIGSVTREAGAPSLQQLGDPLVETDNVPFFDARTGRSILLTTVSGGNRALAADRRTVWKLGGNWQPLEKTDLRLRAEYVHQTIANPQIGFPAATPALEAAFPSRFERNLTGDLVRVDLRPVNADRSTRDTIRWGFDFTKPLKTAPPSAAAIAALRSRFAAMRGAGQQPAGGAQGQRPGATQAPPGGERPPQFRFGGGGPGGGGGAFGGRSGGRLTLSATHTMTLTDRLDIAPGLGSLDYLDGEALSNLGGRPRHQVEVESGYYNNGLGARLTSNWRSGTRVDGAVPGSDLRFSPLATFDLRLFANLGERFDLVAKHPFLIGSSLRFEVKNLLNARPEVRSAGGLVPLAYQPDRLEPIGRTVQISFRKLFVPRRFVRVGGGGGGGGFGGSPGGGSPPAP
jgi:hypothetical protein